MTEHATRRDLSQASLEAWRLSTFGTNVPAEAQSLLDGATETTLSTGQMAHHRSRDVAPALFIVSTGMIRISGAYGDRRVTVGYRSTGDTLGIASVVAPRALNERTRLFAEAVTDCTLLQLQPETLKSLVATSAAVRDLVFDELGASYVEVVELLAEGFFLSIRQRVARCVLDLAIRDDGKQLKVVATHQEIADTIGSVRQVVSRTISSFCTEGLLVRDDPGYILKRPSELHRLVYAE